MGQNQNSYFPTIPVDIQVSVEPYNAAQIAFFFSLAILAALIIYGFIFQR